MYKLIYNIYRFGLKGGSFATSAAALVIDLGAFFDGH